MFFNINGALFLMWIWSGHEASGASRFINDESLRFLVLGDWGGLPVDPFTTPVETTIGTQMAVLAANRRTQFTLALGDNFYFNGVSSVDDKRFQETFEAVFSAPSLQTKWYMVAGNHDHYGNVAAQIAYSANSSRWTFPDYNYTMTYIVPQTQTKVQFVMIDTVLLCGNTYDDVVGDQPKGPNNKNVAEDQWAWLEDTLSSSSADYLIVAGHYPVFSVGSHGPTEILVSRLQPLLYKYRVSTYLSGHDHNLQHIQYGDSTWTVDYFVIGCANFIDPSTPNIKNVPDGSLKFFWADVAKLGGFAYVEANETLMNLTLISGEDDTLYQIIIKPRL